MEDFLRHSSVQEGWCQPHQQLQAHLPTLSCWEATREIGTHCAHSLCWAAEPSPHLNLVSGLAAQRRRPCCLSPRLGTRTWRLEAAHGGWRQHSLCLPVPDQGFWLGAPLQALSNAGVGTPLLAWFQDGLSGRSQFVALQGSSSHSISGVPQGSILGPLLFILTFDGIFCLPLSVRSASDGLHRRCNILQNILHWRRLGRLNYRLERDQWLDWRAWFQAEHR